LAQAKLELYLVNQEIPYFYGNPTTGSKVVKGRRKST
jgi:hypothetical protein